MEKKGRKFHFAKQTEVAAKKNTKHKTKQKIYTVTNMLYIFICRSEKKGGKRRKNKTSDREWKFNFLSSLNVVCFFVVFICIVFQITCSVMGLYCAMLFDLSFMMLDDGISSVSNTDVLNFHTNCTSVGFASTSQLIFAISPRPTLCVIT